MPKNLAKTIHEAPQFSWLGWALASLAPCFFTNHLKLVNSIPGYFFGADISSEQLLFFEELHFWNSHFLAAVIFFQNTYFFGAKHLLSSHFLRIGSSLGQLLFGTATFLANELFWRTLFSKQLLLHSINFLRRATFLEKLIFQKEIFRITSFF